MNYLVDVMADLYSSEINFQINSFFDIGYSVRIGDRINGFVDASLMIDNLNNVAEELVRMAIKHYPASLFAREYGREADAVSEDEAKSSMGGVENSMGIGVGSGE